MCRDKGKFHLERNGVVKISDRIELLYSPNSEWIVRIVDITAEPIALTEEEARKLYECLKAVLGMDVKRFIETLAESNKKTLTKIAEDWAKDITEIRRLNGKLAIVKAVTEDRLCEAMEMLKILIEESKGKEDCGGSAYEEAIV